MLEPVNLTLLAVHAHPDDESIGTGGTLARYISEGVETVLVCATKGEEGEILNPAMDPSKVPSDITELRLREFQGACEILGIRRIFFLGYRDSGMAGRPSNAHPAALINADLQEATERLVRIIRQVRPHVIITYNERGGYGHPDHIAVHRITLSAAAAAGDPALYQEIPWPPWSPTKLYYTATPRSRLLKMKEILEETGEQLGFDMELRSTPDEANTTRIDVSLFIGQKFQAIQSHRSQLSPTSMMSRMPEPMRSQAMSTECYVCVKGCPPPPFQEDDLFQGLRGGVSSSG